MDAVISSLIQSSPAAAASLIIVIVFLRYLAKRDEMLKEISAACHAVSDRSTDALVENAKLTGECASALDKVNVTLIRINGGSPSSR